MFSQSIRLGRILGIPIGINYSWFLIFLLITFSLFTQFRDAHSNWTLFTQVGYAAATSVLFFASVVLHELGHSVVALHYRIPVRSITLFVFGGVAAISREPDKPIHEFNIAIAGPLVSLALGGAFLGLSLVSEGRLDGLAMLGGWLGYINLMLAIFNMVPGLPLDGGRILRALAWRLTGSFERATTIATGSGSSSRMRSSALGPGRHSWATWPGSGSCSSAGSS